MEDLRSSDAGVLTRRPLAPKSGLARFKAVRPGRADIVGDTTMCLTSNEKTACPVAHIVVAARK